MNCTACWRQWMVIVMSATALAIAGCGGGGDDDDNGVPVTPPTVEVSALPLPGSNAVACSNVAQDFSRVAPGDNASDYWEGKPADNGQPQYITDLLADPANTLSFNVAVPNNDTLYGSFAGRSVPYVMIICYPTSAANTRPNYALPTGASIPRMQTGAAPPIFADSTAHYPVIAFSHGLADSPLKDDYLTAMSNFASYGYIVVAPFHGDARIVDVRIEDLEDAARILSRLRDFIALQSLRPLSLTAALDRVLADAQWRDHIDTTQIGGFGASLGGEAMLLLAGAGLTTSAGLSWNSVGVDPRIKAAVGYVPYFGQVFLPAFGRDQHGLDGVTLPFLAISGSADTTAPLIETQQGINRLAGTRELVVLNGVEHGFDVPSTNDIYTWTLTFFDAEIRRLPAARQKLATMAKVAGGGDDRVQIPYNGQ
jgi:hypothetical protein